MDLLAIFSDTLKNNGISIDRHGDIVIGNSGYVVSHVGHEIQIADHQFTYETFVSVLLEQCQIMRSSSEFYASFVGFWYDSSTKIWYSDISQIIDDLDIAKRLGKTRRQVAIFDLRSKSAISL